MKTIITIILSVLVITSILSLALKAIDKDEIYQCNILQDQSQKFSNFYLTQSQNDMCNYHSININAPIK